MKTTEQNTKNSLLFDYTLLTEIVKNYFALRKLLILLRIILEQNSQVLWALRNNAHATY